jgi:hypothetical protein
VHVATAGPGWTLAIDGATFAVSAAFLANLHLPRQLVRARASFMHDLRTGWNEFRSRSWVWSLVVAASLGNLLWGAFSVLGPVVAQQDLGGAAVWGSIMAAMGAGALGGSVLAIRLRPRRPLVLSTLSLATFAAPPALLAAGVQPALIAAGTFLAGAGMMLGISTYESTFQRLIPADVLSRVSSYDWFGSLALQPIGLAIWGPIAVAIGIDAALWLSAALLLASVLAPLALTEVRTMPGEPGLPPTTERASPSRFQGLGR